MIFDSDSKKNSIPDISVWNYSCLILSAKAKHILEPTLKDKGEFLPLNNGYSLFNCLDSIGGETIDQSKSRFNLESEDSIHIPKELTLLPDTIKGKQLFKPGFAHNSFLLCNSEFKQLADENNLGGVVFEENLAKIFL